MTEAETRRASEEPIKLEDRIRIQDVICQFFMHVDLCEFDQIHPMFTSNATMDYASVFGDESQRMTVDTFFSGAKEFLPGFDATQHIITNFCIAGRGDIATCLSHCRGTHRFGDQCWVVGAIFHHRLVHEKRDWKIDFIKCDFLYEEGLRDGIRPIEAARNRQQGRRQGN